MAVVLKKVPCFKELHNRSYSGVFDHMPSFPKELSGETVRTRSFVLRHGKKRVSNFVLCVATS